MSSVEEQLWTNDLIWRKITGYLNISDLKELCCVNKHFLEEVRSLSRFTSLAGQNIFGEMKIHTFRLTKAIVKVNTLDPYILQEVASEIFKETEYLELQGLENYSHEDLNLRLIQIVSNCPKLKSLTFEKLNFLQNDFRLFFSDEDVKSKLAKLEEMQIGKTAVNYKRNSLTVQFNCAKEDRLLSYGLFSNLQLTLVKFVYTDPPIIMSYSHLSLFLNSCSETLQELKLTIDFRGLEYLRGMRFPKLTKLDLAVLDFGNVIVPPPGYLIAKANFLNDVLKFVENHLSNLTELRVSSNHDFCLVRFCDLLRQPKTAKKIKVLCFMSPGGFTESFSSINWDFLKTMQLREFELSVWSRPYLVQDVRQSLYYYLPSTIQSIEFRVFNFHCPLDELFNVESSALLRFQNLTILKVSCLSFINDQMFQFICKHLTKLRIFKGDFTRVNAFGITGVDKSKNMDTGISIANLKGLKELEIRSNIRRRQIPLNVLINAVRFLELVKLKVDLQQKKLELNCPPKKLLLLLRRNPSLERIQIWMNSPLLDIREKVRKLHPRFKWDW